MAVDLARAARRLGPAALQPDGPRRRGLGARGARRRRGGAAPPPGGRAGDGRDGERVGGPVAARGHRPRRGRRRRRPRPSSRCCSRWPTHCARSACRRARNRGAPTSSTRSSGSDASTTRAASWRTSSPARATAGPTPGPVHRARRAPSTRREATTTRPPTVFAAALAEDAATQGSFARARLELAAGRVRAPPRPAPGRRRPPRPRRAAASSTLGAAPFVARCAQERAACAVDARAGGRARALTKAEAAVAALVADGRTNREVAGSLVDQRQDRRVTPRPHLRQARCAVPDRAGDRVAGRERRHRRALMRRNGDRGDPEADAGARFGVPPDDVAPRFLGTLAGCGW